MQDPCEACDEPIEMGEETFYLGDDGHVKDLHDQVVKLQRLAGPADELIQAFLEKSKYLPPPPFPVPDYDMAVAAAYIRWVEAGGVDKA